MIIKFIDHQLKVNKFGTTKNGKIFVKVTIGKERFNLEKNDTLTLNHNTHVSMLDLFLAIIFKKELRQ